eukprot:jgi/Botrbrau1/16688/Bobra.0267s0004.1
MYQSGTIVLCIFLYYAFSCARVSSCLSVACSESERDVVFEVSEIGTVMGSRNCTDYNLLAFPRNATVPSNWSSSSGFDYDCLKPAVIPATSLLIFQ